VTRPFSLICILALLALPAVAAPSTVQKSHAKAIKRTVATKKPRVQQHYSFLPPAKPLVGMVVIQQRTLPPILLPTPPLPEAKQTIDAAPKLNATIQLPPAQPRKTAHFQFWKPWELFGLGQHPTGISERSWVSDVTPAQAAQLAQAIAGFAARQLPAESTSLLLAPPERGQIHNILTPLLQDQLRKSGFALVTSKSQDPKARICQYQVSRLENGILVRINFNHQQASRFYHLSESNALIASFPFSVRIQGEP
jgi:hypothetical protein